MTKLKEAYHFAIAKVSSPGVNIHSLSGTIVLLSQALLCASGVPGARKCVGPRSVVTLVGGPGWQSQMLCTHSLRLLLLETDAAPTPRA